MFVGGVEMSKRPSLKVVIACDCANGKWAAGELERLCNWPSGDHDASATGW